MYRQKKNKTENRIIKNKLIPSPQRMNTKRLSLLVLTLLSSIGSLMAQVVSVSDARQTAASFFAASASARRGMAAGDGTLTLSHTGTTASGAPAYYVFSRGDGDGFVIVSADEGTRRAVLGYSPSGRFAPEASDAFRWLLDSYASGIDSLRRTPLAHRDRQRKALARIAPGGNAVEPLLGDIEWNQGAPFNGMTPTMDGEHLPTGCVITAVAQIMRYHCWPERGQGQVSYYWYGGKQTLSADLSQSVYRWDLMKAHADLYATDEERAAVALLMRDIGYAHHVEYDYRGSGTNIFPEVLTDNFGYDHDLQKVEGDGCSTNEWEQILRTEIKARRPVACGGGSTSGGHEFVCDGYDADGYFHYNYGWGGMNNGYYLSTATGFDASPDLVYNIKKDQGGTGRLSAYAKADFMWTEGNELSCDLGAFCWGNPQQRVEIGLALRNEGTGKVTYYDYCSGADYVGLTAMIFEESVRDGHYALFPVARIEGEEWETFYFRNLRQREVELIVKGGTCTFVNNNVYDGPDEGKVEVNGVFYTLDTENHTAMTTFKNDKYNSYSGRVVIPDEIAYEGVTYVVNAIGERTFQDCRDLTDVYVGRNVQVIYMGAFGSAALRSLTFAAGSMLYYVDGWAFNACDIPSVVLPEGTQILIMCAFQSCSMQRVVIPSTVVSFGQVAFNYCLNLKDVYVFWQQPPYAQEDLFSGLDCSGCTLHVPAGTTGAYAAALPWSAFRIVEDADAIRVPNAAPVTPAARWDLYGRPVFTPINGTIIIENGRKVLKP